MTECFCASLEDHNKPHGPGSDTGRHNTYGREDGSDYPFATVCAKGNEADGYALGLTTKRARSVDISALSADFYMLEALTTGLFASEFFPTREDSPDMLWRRQRGHVLIRGDGRKECGCYAGITETNSIEPCDHDGVLSEGYWNLYLAKRVRTPQQFAGKIINKAVKRQQALVSDLSATFLCYGIYAFATELSYYGELSLVGMNECVCSEEHLEMWGCECGPLRGGHDYNELAGALERLYKEKGGSYLFDQVKAAFDPRENSWAASFGGKNWYDAAHVYYLYTTGQLNDQLFVDRVFNLQHNTGSFLNKVVWGTYPDSVVLEAHKHSYWRTLYQKCSPKVRQLVDRYWDAVNKERSRYGLIRVRPYHTLSRYEY